MEGLDLLNVSHWQPLRQLGYTHSFFSINATTVINTWVVLALLMVIIIPLRLVLTNKKSLARFFTMTYVTTFVGLIEQTLGEFHEKHFYFTTALFSFIALCNMIVIIPGLEEPTQDLNTTLALGIVAFIYAQVTVVQQHGFIAYAREYFQPFFIMFPLNVVSHLASVLSISFRLFGNIFGGATITHLFTSGIRAYAGPTVIGIFALIIGSIMMVPITIIFAVFEGLIQAFVFTMLSLTHLALALQGSSESGEQH